MINFLKRKILINAKGKNINRFIKKLNHNNIEIINIKYIKDNEVNLLVYKEDYDKILEIKSIYEINDTKDYGISKIKRIIQISKYLILSCLLGIVLFAILINLIFDIEVVHNDKDLRNLIIKELNNQGIKRYTFKKNYGEITKIKNNVIKKYPNKIEWLEIEEKGTKYVIRVEERKINNIEEDKKPRNLTALKNGVIKKIINNRGQTLVEPNTYVNKNDIIISGTIYLNEKEMGKERASGTVFAEVWYNVKTTYPVVSYNKIKTNNKKDVVVLNFLNKDIEFTFNKFKNKQAKEKILIKNNLLPFNLSIQKQNEVILKDEVLTYDEALIKAEKYTIDKMKSRLKEKEYIIRNKKLKSVIKDSKIEIEMFFAIYEDITNYVEIGD